MCDKSIQIIANLLKYGNYLFRKIVIHTHSSADFLFICSKVVVPVAVGVFKFNNTTFFKEDEIDGSKNDKFFSKWYGISMNYGNTLRTNKKKIAMLGVFETKII